MKLVFTIVAPDSVALREALDPALDAVVFGGRPVSDTEHLSDVAMDIFTEGGDLERLRAAAGRALERTAVDWCVQPAEGRRKALLVADMDSTIIGCECLDELADFAGVKDRVSAITERAMAGELNFESALRERVGMLKGLGLEALAATYAERVRLNPGAAVLGRTMAAHGARCVLVSGGFTYFTERVAAAAAFAAYQANRLIDDGARLTGEVAEPILGREAKLAALQREADALGVELSATLAVGDGANDLAMIAAAGLGVAYHAKPIVAAEADAQVRHTDLTALLYFQGYGAEAFA
jgi:phosphoserine phosphatase